MTRRSARLCRQTDAKPKKGLQQSPAIFPDPLKRDPAHAAILASDLQNDPRPWMWQDSSFGLLTNTEDIKFPLTHVQSASPLDSIDLAHPAKFKETPTETRISLMTWKAMVESTSNAAKPFLTGYLLLLLCLTLWQDVEWEQTRQSYVILQDAALCAKEFHANACSSPVPYLMEQCYLWKLCMDSDVSGIKRTVIVVQIVAELLSEFVEGFFGRLSYKTCVFFSIIFVFRNVGKSPTS